MTTAARCPTQYRVTLTDMDGQERAHITVSSGRAARDVMYAALDRLGTWGIKALPYTRHNHMTGVTSRLVTVDEHLPRRR